MVSSINLNSNYQEYDSFSIDKTYQKITAASQSIWGNGALKKELESLSAEQLKNILDKLSKNENDFVSLLDKLSEVIPIEKLQEAVRIEYPNHIDGLHQAKEMFREAKYYLEKSESNFAVSLQTQLQNVLDAIIRTFENVLFAFGIAEFFTITESSAEAKVKAQIVLMLLNLFTLLSSMILPISGAGIAGLIIGGILLSISIISLLYPYIRPEPFALPKAENWTKLYRNGMLEFAEGRKGTMDDIARMLIAGKALKIHPMLVGRSGVGKTETVKGFVAAIEKGEYPELKGKKVFYLNTANLVNSRDAGTGENKVLSKISEIMGRHRENIVLVFDEMHLFCQKSGASAISEQLKSLLDKGKDAFPYVIGITSEEEFFRDIYKNNPAFARRFKLITVGDTDDADTIQILNNAFLKKAPNMILEAGISQTLLQKTKAAFVDPQPASALKILLQCLKKTAKTQKSPLEEKIEKIRSAIQSLCSQGAVRQGSALVHNGSERIDQLEETLKQLEWQIQEEKLELERLFLAREHLGEVKVKAFKIAAKAKEAVRPVLSNKEQNQLVLLTHFLAPTLEKKVRNEAERLGVKTVIDSKLVDEVIAEELLNLKKSEEAVTNGKKGITARGG